MTLFLPCSHNERVIFSMTQLTYLAVSAYRIRMERVLLELRGAGQFEITQEALAEKMGGKITASFRRRVSELQRDGLVTRFTYCSDRGGYKVAYQIHGG